MSITIVHNKMVSRTTRMRRALEEPAMIPITPALKSRGGADVKRVETVCVHVC